MATDATWTPPGQSTVHKDLVSDNARLSSIPLAILRVLTSLKITVALFALVIIIVLVGTLVQVDMDMWEVINLYFRSWIARIDLQVFFPKSWFPKTQSVPGFIWFPGGALI